MKLGSISDSLE